MPYPALECSLLVEGMYELTPLRQEDIFKIAQWRNAQMNILRQKIFISEAMQELYYKEQILRSFNCEHPRLILFSFLEHNKCIGYGGLVYIDWDAKRAEVSFLVAPERAQELEIYKNDFRHYLKLIKCYAFKGLKLNRLFTETYSFRKEHKAILEAEGFVLEGCLRQHVDVENKLEDSLIHGMLRKDYEI